MRSEDNDGSMPYYLELVAADPLPVLVVCVVWRLQGNYILRACYRFLTSPAWEARYHQTLSAASDAEAVEQLMTSLRRSINAAAPLKRFPIYGGYHEVFAQLRDNSEVFLRAISIPTLPVIYNAKASQILDTFKGPFCRDDYVPAIMKHARTEKELAPGQVHFWVFNILTEDADNLEGRAVQGLRIGGISSEKH